jgi:hypothetical protein
MTIASFRIVSRKHEARSRPKALNNRAAMWTWPRTTSWLRSWDWIPSGTWTLASFCAALRWQALLCPKSSLARTYASLNQWGLKLLNNTYNKHTASPLQLPNGYCSSLKETPFNVRIVWNIYKNYLCERLITSTPFVSRVSTKCESLDVTQTYGPPRTVTALPFITWNIMFNIKTARAYNNHCALNAQFVKQNRKRTFVFHIP